MDEVALLASITSFPVILPYAYVVGGNYSILWSLIACLFTAPCSALLQLSLKSRPSLYIYPTSFMLSLPLTWVLFSQPIRLDFQSLLLLFYGSFLGTRLLTTASRAQLKVPSICVATRRRVGHVIATQFIPNVLTRLYTFAFFLMVSSFVTLPFASNLWDVELLTVSRELVLTSICLCVFFDTCLATTLLFMTLPPQSLTGKAVCDGLAKDSKLSFWECSLFLASGRGSREFAWQITPIGGRIVNWNAMVDPALKCLKDATVFLDKNRPKKADKFNWRKPAQLDLPDSEKVLWSLDTVGCLVFHAYQENKNGVTQVHFKGIMDTLFSLEATAAASCAPSMIQDKIRSTLYKICTRYASAVHAIELDGRYVDRFVSYSDFKV